MRYLELIYDGKSIKNQKKIEEILQSKKFYWLIDSEIEEAKIEIKKDTIIWHSGYFLGIWPFGIFKSGEFHGKWINGIFEGGIFLGTGNINNLE
jgi:hypothetical protein